MAQTEDNNGNTLNETTASPAAVTSYTWDRDNRLRQVTPPSPGVPTSYAYDAFGLRIQRIDSTGNVNYLLDGRTVIEELDGTFSTTTRFLNHPRNFDEVISLTKGGATHWPLTDALGSIYATTDSSGAIAHRYDFDVYGVRTDLGGNGLGIDVGYTGRWHDSNGLIEHRDRQRRPELGRWLQADRLRIRNGLDLYLYALSSPTENSDSSGLIRDSPTAKFLIALALGDFEEAAGLYEIATGAAEGTGVRVVAKLVATVGAVGSTVRIAGACVTVARGTFAILSQAGVDPQLLVIRTQGSGLLGFDTTGGGSIQVSTNGFHVAVIADGRVYDQATGVGGLPYEEYESRLATGAGGTITEEIVSSFDEIPEVLSP